MQHTWSAEAINSALVVKLEAGGIWLVYPGDSGSAESIQQTFSESELTAALSRLGIQSRYHHEISQGLKDLKAQGPSRVRLFLIDGEVFHEDHQPFGRVKEET